MGAKSSIEWTDASWTPIRARNLETGKVGWHCERITTGCGTPTEGGCYAEKMNLRLGTGLPFKPGHRKDIEIFLDEQMLLAPLRWKKPRMIFVCSMTDLFAEFMLDEWIDRVFAVMALCPQHTFQVLTKRAERMRDYISSPNQKRRVLAARDDVTPGVGSGKYNAKAALDAGARLYSGPLPNVWLGVSAERQQEADERIPHLLDTPTTIRFISAEPLLGPIDLTRIQYSDEITFNVLKGPNKLPFGHFDGATLDWVIVGGESGPNSRPMHPDWARSLQKQCEAAGVEFFFKQRGEYTWVDDSDYDNDAIPELPPNWRERTDDKYICMRADGSRSDGYGGDSSEFLYRVGKKAAGRLLDGREHNDIPKAHTS
jgi:protein gp37